MSTHHFRHGLLLRGWLPNKRLLQTLPRGKKNEKSTSLATGNPLA
ncbi:hypothetical protein ARMA_2756 [Ardenticatena maritima]|uniref:Uncharacterized protein n=1 Tax=Ardenticatena maritima TaxID=872965 RepID=A0A0M8K942_9CHLR|nr:hypothetical protein ARMA_2756 [Ardenticatena maritima]